MTLLKVAFLCNVRGAAKGRNEISSDVGVYILQKYIEFNKDIDFKESCISDLFLGGDLYFLTNGYCRNC